MRFVTLLAAAGLSSHAFGSVVIQSVTSTWHGTVTVRRAVTLGGGTDTGGESGSSGAFDVLQGISGHAQVGPDFADIGGTVRVVTTPAGVTARYEYQVSGEIEHPANADFGAAQIDVYLDVRVAFMVTSAAEIGLSATNAFGSNLVNAGVLEANGGVVFGIGPSEADSRTLVPGTYEARFLFLGPSLFTTGPGNVLAFAGEPEFRLSVPQPWTMAVLALAGFGARRSRAKW